MAYIDGFVIAVPTANKQQFIAHADKGDSAFIDHGATRVVECWGADVPKGKTTDFQGAVAAKDDETVVFSWIVYKSKAHRDRVNAKVMKDPRIAKMMDPKAMPFDMRRMSYGGFEVSRRLRMYSRVRGASSST